MTHKIFHQPLSHKLKWRMKKKTGKRVARTRLGRYRITKEEIPGQPTWYEASFRPRGSGAWEYVPMSGRFGTEDCVRTIKAYAVRNHYEKLIRDWKTIL